MTVTPLRWDQDCSLKIREPEVLAPWFLDPGGWSKTAAVSLYFIFPGICTLSLTFPQPTFPTPPLKKISPPPWDLTKPGTFSRGRSKPLTSASRLCNVSYQAELKESIEERYRPLQKNTASQAAKCGI
ncbi:hypothetical protein STEG23_034682 [Scotinomys teguina]